MAARVAATATVRAVKPGKFRPRRAAITLTSSAVNRVKELLSESQDSENNGCLLGASAYYRVVQKKVYKFNAELRQNIQRVAIFGVRMCENNNKWRELKEAIERDSSANLDPAMIRQAFQGMIGLRIGVKERGCNGLSYTLDYVTEKKKFDEIVNQDGVEILIDSKAQLSLLGTEMDYVDGLIASEFVFNNPNIKGTCGCGESFHL